MMEGQVNAKFEAKIEISMAGPTGKYRNLEGVVDTGYNGFIALQENEARELELPFLYSSRATLANGHEIELNIYEATVIWNEEPIDVKVACTAGDTLVGMRLMQGFNLNMNIQVDGAVTIKPLS